MDYGLMAVFLIAGYFLFRVFTWIITTAIKLAFVVAFIALGVLAMSSSVGLL